MMYVRLFFSLILFISYGVSTTVGDTKVAVAHLVSQNVTGTIYFNETTNGVHIYGIIVGLRPGLYGFHVHEFGDTSTCDATGPHFDPHGRNHGGQHHEVRHVGDFGNVNFVGTSEVAVATVDFVDRLVTLSGRNSVLGRGLVLHEREDDLGLGDDETSLITGNAGPRIACGPIVIKSGIWNSGYFTYSSPTLIFFLIAFMLFV